MKLAAVTLGLALCWPLVGCGSSKSGGSGSGGDGPAMSTKPAERPMRPRDAMRQTPPRRRPVNAVTEGPTGIADCDQALDIVCRCAKKEASLRRPCKTLQGDAPRWKTAARNQDAKQLEDTRKACQRILKGIQAAYGCK